MIRHTFFIHCFFNVEELKRNVSLICYGSMDNESFICLEKNLGICNRMITADGWAIYQYFITVMRPHIILDFIQIIL